MHILNEEGNPYMNYQYKAGMFHKLSIYLKIYGYLLGYSVRISSNDAITKKVSKDGKITKTSLIYKILNEFTISDYGSHETNAFFKNLG